MAILGWPELIIILVIVIFIFGASRLKGLAKGVGESVKEFRKASEGQTNSDTNEDIIKAAEKMGISTKGKDIQQILKEMQERSEKEES